MERNRDTLIQALQQLPAYEPDEAVWQTIRHQLAEAPLQQAIQQLPNYEPDEAVWQAIQTTTRPQNNDRFRISRWAAAAVGVLVSSLAIWLIRHNSPEPPITYATEVVDTRLLPPEEPLTDATYQQLKAYCEAETVVCHSPRFRQLQAEYQTLQAATEQLQQAMGHYNTEPELVRQLSEVERQKASILNQMAKLI
ncbi:hypothetical protein GCM10023187_42910 [Nibrella viscosa]|uniref:Anti-sigma factor n=1 Tax=Nibrella viscosa TaxID=1084524 RepID=A0ABP8KR68_9BACT